MKMPLAIAASLVGFVAAGALTYRLAPSPNPWAIHHLEGAVRHHNLFIMVNQLDHTNHDLVRQAQGVNAVVIKARQQLSSLGAVNQALGQETASNQAVLATMNQAIGLNHALILSQQQIVRRESHTLADDELVGQNLSALGAPIQSVSASMQTLYGDTQNLQGSLGSLSTNLNGVVTQLQDLETNTSIPLVNVPLTSLAPPIFGSTATHAIPLISSPTAKTVMPLLKPSLTPLTSTVTSLLGGL